ncbi:MAG: non-homologous end-joining DNA ligase [Thermodesulfovibrionaceae bacterium]
MLDQKILPMLAFFSEPFDSEKHIFEIKWDGTRCIMFLKDGKIKLQNRRLLDITYRYPELLNVGNYIQAKNAILDGEIIVLENGKPNFEKLQTREQASEPFKIEILSQRIPATYIVFDVLYLNNKKVIDAPLIERKSILKSILKNGSNILESDFIYTKGIDFYNRVVDLGYEGVMAKNVKSPYLIGKRSKYWLKIKKKSSLRCYIVGYTKGKGKRANFGAFIIATKEAEEWLLRGKVGTGFSEKFIEEIMPVLSKLRVGKPLISSWRIKNAVWLKPELVCEVSYQEITEKGQLRAPVFSKLIL